MMSKVPTGSVKIRFAGDHDILQKLKETYKLLCSSSKTTVKYNMSYVKL